MLFSRNITIITSFLTPGKVCTTYKHIHSKSEMGKIQREEQSGSKSTEMKCQVLSRHFSDASHCQNMFKNNFLTFQTLINTTDGRQAGGCTYIK